MDVIRGAQELEGAAELLQEVACDDLVQTAIRGRRILAGHLVCGRISTKFVPLLDEHGQVTELAVFHD
jgi:hypothetical protein